MKKYIFAWIATLLLILGIASVSSYNLSERDEDLLDRVEERIISYIDDESNSVSAQVFLNYIDWIFDTRELTEKQALFLDIIYDDISYVYYLGDYADDYGNMLPEDCYEDEYYDEGDRMCYYDDTSYEETNEDYAGEYDHGGHSDHDHESPDVLASYEIEGNTLRLTAGENSTVNSEVWNEFTRIIPLSVRSDFKEYHVVNEKNGDTAAHVEQDDEDNSKWNMTINLDALIENDKVSEEGRATLIHEFAHVLTLGPKQMRYYPQTENESLLERFSEKCTTNLLQEGCLNEDAYLDDFIDMFWSDSKYLEKVRNEEVNAYDDNPSHFITDYAATNPGEDIAESFTYYVLQTLPNQETVADKKLLFFTSYPELVTLRKQIRSRLQ